jgi:hypothetical protein
MSQQAQVLNHLKKATLTPLEALRKYGTFRLAAIIFNLRDEGYIIETNSINLGTKKKPKYVANYKLITAEQNNKQDDI